MTHEDLQRVGELLIEEGVLSQEDVERAVSEAGFKGTPIASLLQKSHHVKRADLSAFLATDFVVPRIDDLRTVDLFEDAIELVPELLARKHMFLPIVRMGDVLCIARPNYFNRAGLADLRRQTGLRVKVFQADEEQVAVALDRAYKGSRAPIPAPKAAPKAETTVLRATPAPPSKAEEFDAVPLISMESDETAALRPPAAVRPPAPEPDLEEVVEFEETPTARRPAEILTAVRVPQEEYDAAERGGMDRIIRDFEELCGAVAVITPVRMG